MIRKNVLIHLLIAYLTVETRSVGAVQNNQLLQSDAQEIGNSRTQGAMTQYYFTKKYSKTMALRQLDNIIKHHPNQYEANLEMGYLLLDRQENKKALPYFLLAKKILASNEAKYSSRVETDQYQLLMNRYYLTKKTNRSVALSQLTEIMQRYPDKYESNLEMGYQLLARAQEKEALAFLLTAKKLLASQEHAQPSLSIPQPVEHKKTDTIAALEAPEPGREQKKNKTPEISILPPIDMSAATANTTKNTGKAVTIPVLGEGAASDTSPMFEFYLPENDEGERGKKVTLTRYDKNIYELAYTVYIQNNNNLGAFTIAMAAVKQQPENRLWRERLAQVSLWNHQPAFALEQNLYLLEHYNDTEAGLKGLTLAKSIHDDQMAIEYLAYFINHGNNSQKIWEDYIHTMLHSGEVEKLTEMLNANKDKISSVLYLGTLEKISQLNDDPESQLNFLKRLSKAQGMKPETAQEMAILYLNRGDVAVAANVLDQARRTVSSSNKDFWIFDAEMANLTHHREHALYANQQLLKQKQPGIDVYWNLITLTDPDNSEMICRYLKQGLAHYPKNPDLIRQAFGILAANGQCIAFPALEATMSPSMLKEMYYSTSYWSARANYWKKAKNDGRVLETYREGLKYLTMDDSFKSDYIYFLLETNNLALLRRTLPLWQDNLVERGLLWAPYAESYANLHNPLMTRLILSLFYDQFKQYETNPYWLILFKDTLANSFFDRQSTNVTQYAWPYYLNLLKKQSSPPDYSQKLNYVKLSITNAAGDPTAVALSQLQSHENEDVELLMLTWALDHNNINLSKAIYLRYKEKGMEPPAWATLSIALTRHDKPMMKNLLTGKKPISSYRDKIRAAIEIDAIKVAQTAAFEALKVHRKDSDLYDNFFTPVMLKTSNNAYVSQEYYQYGNVVGPRTIASYTYFLTPGVSATPHNSIWFTRNQGGSASPSGNSLNASTNQALANVPSRDERAGVLIDTLQRRGNLSLDLGYRNDLDSFPTAILKRTYTAHSDLNLYGALGYNQPTDDTTSMLVGGMKDDLELGFTFHLFTNDYISGEYKENVFYTQDNQYLAQGMQATLRYDHKIWNVYPDWTLSPYTTVTQYYDKTNELLRGNVLSLVPANVIPNVNFMIPTGFFEYGLTLSFGQSYIDEYTHSWRPMASATISNSTSIGLGQLYNLGFAGSVIGRDHLLLYYEWGTNQGQGLQTSSLVKLSYRLYN